MGDDAGMGQDRPRRSAALSSHRPKLGCGGRPHSHAVQPVIASPMAEAAGRRLVAAEREWHGAFPDQMEASDRQGICARKGGGEVVMRRFDTSSAGLAATYSPVA